MASSAMASAAGVAMPLTTAIVAGSAVAYNVTAAPVARSHMERVTRTAAVVDSPDIHKCSQRKSRFSSLLLPVPPFSGSSSVRAGIDLLPICSADLHQCRKAYIYISDSERERDRDVFVMLSQYAFHAELIVYLTCL